MRAEGVVELLGQIGLGQPRCRVDREELVEVGRGQIEAGKLELNPQTVQLTPLIKDVIGTAGQLAAQNKNRIPAERLSRVSSDDWLGSFALVPVGTILVGPLAATRVARAAHGRG